MAKGYLVVDLHITNPGPFQEYREKVLATVEAYGGRFLVRGGDPRLIEGDVDPGRVVLLEFESPDQAMDWYNSPAYQAILPMRFANATARVVLATGV